MHIKINYTNWIKFYIMFMIVSIQSFFCDLI